MVNSWSLAWEVLNGTMDETYPIREDVPEDLWGKKIDMSVGAGNTAYDFDDLDYEIDYYTDSADYMSDIDDQYLHHFFTETEKPMAHYFNCLLYTSPSPRDSNLSRMPSSA